METALLERLRAAAAAVFPGSPVLAAYAYGSRVSGRPRPGSDVDIGYYLGDTDAVSFCPWARSRVWPPRSSTPWGSPST